MVGHECPSIAGGAALAQDGAQPFEERVPIVVIVEDLASLDASDDDVVQCSRCV
jgi:hypothetical protein